MEMQTVSLTYFVIQQHYWTNCSSNFLYCIESHMLLFLDPLIPLVTFFVYILSLRLPNAVMRHHDQKAS